MTKVIMPSELTAENGAKALLMGEFYQKVETVCCPECNGEGCFECDGKGEITASILISWDNIKKIYKMAVKHLSEPLPEVKK